MDKPLQIKVKHRKIVLMISDIILISASFFSSWLILMRRISIFQHIFTMFVSWAIFLIAFSVVYWLFGMYDSIWRYAEAYEFIKCITASLVATSIFVLSTWFWLRPPYFLIRVPLTVYFLSALMAGGSTLFIRMAYRAYRSSYLGKKHTSGLQKVLVVGAGHTGNSIIQSIYHDNRRQYEIICAVDDDPDKQGRRIQRVKVIGQTKDIPKLVERHGIDVIILAIPNATNKEIRRITNICAKTKCRLKKVDNPYLFIKDGPMSAQIMDVSVEDLLGREAINLKTNKSKYLEGKTVLVTGAGGSIGSELCRQIVLQAPKRLVLLDINENGIYDIQQQLLRKYRDKLHLHAEVASVRDLHKLEIIFERYHPDIVYHAAAHKHVPLMESAPEEAVKNNIFGTLNMAQCADRSHVKRFVMISTDKAVNPTNVMGATKRCCEMIIQSMAQISKTEFVAVRFGNVLGSNGSVIPLFKEQISLGGPITVTHPDIIRYFMTIPEAVSLVLTAGEMAKGGEIFVLNMGEPVKILDLAESLIRMSGLEPYKDIAIEFSGLRPGEKLYEELLMDEEGLQKTPNQKIFIGSPINISPSFFNTREQLKILANQNKTEPLLHILHDLVPGYQIAKH